MRTVERIWVQQSIPITTTQPTIEAALNCASRQQVGHEFKNYSFVDDKLKNLMKKEFRTSLQLMVPNTPTTHVGVPIQQTQIQYRLVNM
jgi:hypothetical protein